VANFRHLVDLVEKKGLWTVQRTFFWGKKGKLQHFERIKWNLPYLDHMFLSVGSL
jgi:hypothetical protein